MSRTEIRHATLSDASLLAELGSRTFYEAFAADTPEKDMAAYLAESFTPVKLATQIADRLSLFFIAENNDEAIGYARLYPVNPPPCVNGPNPIQLARLYVLKEWYGQGVGSSLMKACLSEARRRGYQAMWLSTWDINVRAISFYRRWQFQQVGTQTFQVGSDIQSDVVLMRMIEIP
jgi:predicted N-acetyltransferase YhbS